jgi:hypothetical protein
MIQKFAAIERNAVENHSATGAVYGVGPTPEKAIQDAKIQSGDADSEYDVIAITDAAYEVVLAQGGEPDALVVDTHQRCILTREEYLWTVET